MLTVRILLVDDEERFVLTLARLLKGRNISADTAFSGSQALSRLSSEPAVSVVVLDVRMPGMDGLETLSHIKQQFPGIEVIMLTGQATLEDGVQALRRGAFDYLQKPCEVDELEAIIRKAISVERIRRDPILWPRSAAGEVIVSGFIPLLPNDSLERALTVFNRYRHGEGAKILFVVDAQRHIQGMIDRSQLLAAAAGATDSGNITWQWLCHHPESLPHWPVSSIMNSRVVTVVSETALADSARLMLQHHYDSMPVVAANELKGIIRLQDVLRYLDASEDEPMEG